MRLDFLTAVAVMANVLGAAMAIPQAHQLFRTRRVAGVSPVWAAMSLIINLWWAVYGFGISNLAILPVSMVSSAAYLAIAIALWMFDPSGRGDLMRRLATGSAVGLIPIPALLIGGWEAAGVLLGLMYALQLTPAVVEVYRSHDVSGVSTTTWLLSWIEALLWGIYSIPAADAGLFALGGAGLVMSSLVLFRLLVRPRGVRRSETGLAEPHLAGAGARFP